MAIAGSYCHSSALPKILYPDEVVAVPNPEPVYACILIKQ
jgi:hypothetical protein